MGDQTGFLECAGPPIFIGGSNWLALMVQEVFIGRSNWLVSLILQEVFIGRSNLLSGCMEGIYWEVKLHVFDRTGGNFLGSHTCCL